MHSPGKGSHIDGHDECTVAQKCRARCAFIPVDCNFGRFGIADVRVYVTSPKILCSLKH